MNTLFGSVYGIARRPGSGVRLTAAGAIGIAQVVAPGGLDQAASGPSRRCRRQYLDDIAAGRRRVDTARGAPLSSTTRA